MRVSGALLRMGRLPMPRGAGCVIRVVLGRGGPLGRRAPGGSTGGLRDAGGFGAGGAAGAAGSGGEHGRDAADTGCYTRGVRGGWGLWDMGRMPMRRGSGVGFGDER